MILSAADVSSPADGVAPLPSDSTPAFRREVFTGRRIEAHIFWDEMYLFPFYLQRDPDLARALLLYRYNRLGAARAYAVSDGRAGAMFPWQSGSSGREETQVIHLNPISGEWGDDYSSLQRHISIAVAYNIWYYYNVSEDLEFLTQYGAEMFLRFVVFGPVWQSLTKSPGGIPSERLWGLMNFMNYTRTARKVE